MSSTSPHPTLDFKTEPYFPVMAMILACIFLLVGGLLLFTSVIAGVILIIICILVITTHYRIAINTQAATIHPYVWVLGMKNGEREKYDQIEYLFIKSNKVSQRMNSRINSSTVHKEVYDAYIRLSESNKIHIARSESKAVLLRKVRTIASQLSVNVIDYTSGEPQEI